MLSEAQLEQLASITGFDKPIVVSYVDWLGKVLRLDLGRSTRYNEPVWDTIKRRFPISIFYGVTTLILTYAICIPLGIWKAIRHNRTLFDNVSSGFVFLGYAIPGYVVGIALLTSFASRLGWFPLGGFVSDNFEQLSAWGRYATCSTTPLPLLSYMAGSFAVTTFMMKNSLMDNLSADYVRTAIAKGLSFRRAVFRPCGPQQPHSDRDVVRQQHRA